MEIKQKYTLLFSQLKGGEVVQEMIVGETILDTLMKASNYCQFPSVKDWLIRQFNVANRSNTTFTERDFPNDWFDETQLIKVLRFVDKETLNIEFPYILIDGLTHKNILVNF